MGKADFDISDDGSLLYAPGDSWGYEDRVVFLLPQTDNVTSTPHPTRLLRNHLPSDWNSGF
jgi:hypothetical protein